MSYSNFKDPFGLLKRMLFSGNKVAYSVLVREFLTKILIPVDYLLNNSERKKLKDTKVDSELPIILVLGGSRSGTTLMYQTLVQYLPVSYINNFISSFSRSPISAFKIFRKLISKPKKSFDSYYGSVAGLGGPNDAFFLWNRWLGDDRNYLPETIDEELKIEMRRFFSAWLSVTKKPFLNKNNRNSLCAPMFDSIFKNVFFVEIYRNPVYVAQSLILSRRTVQGSDRIGWGLLSKDSVESDDPLAYIDDICHQVSQVNRLIEKNRKKIDPKKYFRISFEEFCDNPGAFIQKVGLVALDKEVAEKSFKGLQFSKASNGQRLKDDEFSRIQRFFENLHLEDDSIGETPLK